MFLMSNNINWVKIMEANRETIEETIKQAKRETFGTMQGWHVDIEINEKGEAWTTELFSTGSQSISSWKGETFIVCSIKSWEPELNFYESIIWEPEIEAEYEKQKNTDEGIYNLGNWLYSVHPEVIEEWENDEKEGELAEFDPSVLLDRAIEDEITAS
jgi:hypothetical protein